MFFLNPLTPPVSFVENLENNIYHTIHIYIRLYYYLL